MTTGSNTKTNYYAFGMPMPGRSYQSLNGYRYGMNGQEKDLEIFEGAMTAEFWEYDSRIGKRWNTDPVVKPWESSYACFSNNPIWFSDVNGDDAGTSDLFARSGDNSSMSFGIGDGNASMKTVGEGDKCITCPVNGAPTTDKVANSRQDNLVTPKVPEFKPTSNAAPKEYYFQQDNRSDYSKEQDKLYGEEVTGSTFRGALIKYTAPFNTIRNTMDLYSFGFSNLGFDSHGREMSVDDAKEKLLGLALTVAPELGINFKFVSTQTWKYRGGGQSTFGFGVLTKNNSMFRLERHSFNVKGTFKPKIVYTTHINIYNSVNKTTTHTYLNPFKSSRYNFPN